LHGLIILIAYNEQTAMAVSAFAENEQ